MSRIETEFSGFQIITFFKKSFFMIAFASYVDTQAEDNFRQGFSSWLKVRILLYPSSYCKIKLPLLIDAHRNLEVSAQYSKPPLRIQSIICSQIIFLRKLHGSRLNVFAPVNDLSALSKTGSSDRAGGLVAGPRNNVAIAGGQILGDEWSDHVVKVNQNTVAT